MINMKKQQVKKPEKLEPGFGAIGVCSAGIVGVITSQRPEPVEYADGNTGVAWKGIVIQQRDVAGRGGHEGEVIRVLPGDSWSSRNPRVVGRDLNHFIESMMGSQQEVDARECENIAESARATVPIAMGCAAAIRRTKFKMEHPAPVPPDPTAAAPEPANEAPLVDEAG